MKKLLLIFLGILVFLTTVVLAIWFNLGLIVNEKNISYLKDRFALPLSWSELHIDIQNLSWKQKHFDIQAKDFCFQWEKPRVHICFATLQVAAKVAFQIRSPFVQVSEILLDGTTSVAQVVLESEKPEESAAKTKPFWPDLRAPSFADFVNPYLAYVDRKSIRSVHLNIPQALLQKEDLLIQAHAQLTYLEEGLRLTGQVDLKKSQTNYLEASLESSLSLEDPKLEVRLKAKTAEFKSSLEGHLTWASEVDLQSSFASQKYLPVQGGIRLQGSRQGWQMNLQTDVNLEKWNLGKAQVKDCPIFAPLSDGGNLAQVNLSCDVELLRVEKLVNRFLPSTVSIHVDSKNTFSFQDPRLNIESLLKVHSKQNTLIDISLNGNSDVQVDLLKFVLNKISIPNFEALVKIEKVSAWQEVFKKNSVPLPAPLNALDGQIELKTQVQSPDIKVLTSQTTLSTSLQGKEQKLITFSQANLDVDLNSKEITLEGDVNLKEIAADLPYIGLEAPPQIVPDSRFKGLPKTKETKKRIWKFNLKKFSIRTPEKPIIVRTRLLKDPIPVRVNYTFAGTDYSGNVGLDPFGVELFNKRFKIEKFKVIKHERSEVMDLDGELTYSNSEVKVSILVIGTTTAPKIEFLSHPPLSREQIISVILFNKSLQQLTNEDRLVAGQMNQALLSDAFGLFSLLFLSSTPIESIYYDPVSKSYTARVKLDDQTSLSVGSNFDTSQQFQLRRRLGGPWSVVTELQKSQNADDTITTLIEWFRRF